MSNFQSLQSGTSTPLVTDSSFAGCCWKRMYSVAPISPRFGGPALLVLLAHLSLYRPLFYSLDVRPPGRPLLGLPPAVLHRQTDPRTIPRYVGLALIAMTPSTVLDPLLPLTSPGTRTQPVELDGTFVGNTILCYI